MTNTLPDGQPHADADPWFDPLTDGHLANPYETYRRLRGAHPVYWHDQLQSWVISRHAYCGELLARPELFAADFRRAGRQEDEAMVSVLTLDGPQHAPYRALISGRMSPRHWADLMTDNRSWLEDQVSSRKGAQVDLVADLCLPLAVRSVARIVGIDQVDDELHAASAAVVASMFSGLEPAAEAPGMAARSELSRMLANAAKKARHGLLADGQRYQELPYLINSIRVVLLAGINSASRFLGLALLSILSGPGLGALTPELDMTLAINELIRFDGPFQALSRIAVRDYNFHGHEFLRGQELIALIGSANRDEAVFDEPDTLRLSRRPNEHLGFGLGSHSCLGAPLAVELTGELLSCLARLVPDSSLTGTVVMDRNPTLRGAVVLPARLA